MDLKEIKGKTCSFFILVFVVAVSVSHEFLTHLIFVPSKAAAFHGAGVEVALVVKLEAGQAGMQLIEDRRQAAPESQ